MNTDPKLWRTVIHGTNVLASNDMWGFVGALIIPYKGALNQTIHFCLYVLRENVLQKRITYRQLFQSSI